jgi:predicted aminopeptidase
MSASYAMLPFMKRRGVRMLIAISLLFTALASCRTTRYYSQALHGQWQVLARARPIEQVSAAADTPAEVKEKLALVAEMRTFAHSTLKLPTHRQYRNYADLGRKFVVWNVFAAPEFSIEAKSWSYPIVGKLKYRGFFDEEAAKAEAAGLKDEGFDVMVGGVRVYSTLGFFSDPVLNTFIKDEEADLAETLFHELTHARFFVAGDTDFNEAYATAAGQLGVRAWFRARGDAKGLKHYEESLKRSGRILALLKDTRSELGTLYAKNGSMTDEEMRRAKAIILNETKVRYETLRHKSTGTASTPPTLNNARLAALATYHDLVPAFIRLFHEQADDWEKFHRAVAAMKPLSKEERRARLEATATASAAPRTRQTDRS